VGNIPTILRSGLALEPRRILHELPARFHITQTNRLRYLKGAFDFWGITMTITLDLPTMQWVSTTALTLASLTVSIVAAIIGYRNSRGWEPVLLLSVDGLASGIPGASISVKFEIWNRRKYPIVIRFIEISLREHQLLNDERKQLQDWENWWIFHNKVCHQASTTVEPGKHESFRRGVLFKPPQKFEGLTAVVACWYFDPLLAKKKYLFAERRFGATNEHGIPVF